MTNKPLSFAALSSSPFRGAKAARSRPGRQVGDPYSRLCKTMGLHHSSKDTPSVSPFGLPAPPEVEPRALRTGAYAIQPGTSENPGLRAADSRPYSPYGKLIPLILPLYRISGAGMFHPMGNVTLIVVPVPGRLETSMPALWSMAACLTMDSPRPVPPTSLEWLLSTR